MTHSSRGSVTAAARMPRSQPTRTDGGCEWRRRAEFWQGKVVPSPRRNRANAHEPLILSGHGIGLRINHGALVVRNGFTHYPQTREESRFFPGDWRQPSRIIVIDGDGSLTFDVLAWLAEQRIPLIQVDWRGHTRIVAGSNYAAEPRWVNVQRRVQSDPVQAMALSRWLITEKIARSAAALTEALPSSAATRDALKEFAESTHEIERHPPRNVNALRGIEGRAALAYFRAWRAIPLHWKGTGHRPIPEDWRHVAARVRPNRTVNRGATHPMNAILNYSYAVLQSQVQIAIVSAGLDPTIGLMHTTRKDRPAFVLDLMEPLRPAVDAIVLRFVQENDLAPQDFTIGADGTCRLHPALARRVVAETGDIDGIKSVVSDVLRRCSARTVRTRRP